MSRRSLPWICFALIVVLATVLRVYQLRDLPAGFYCDEAGLGYNAYTIANHGTDEQGHPFPMFFWSFGVSYKNPAFVYAAAPLVKLLGPNELSVRLTSALFGIGTVIGIFFLGRALLGIWVGVLASLFLAIVPWHLHFSRIGFELISFPFFFVIGLTFFVRFTQGRRTLPLAMLFFGLCFYAYKVANLFVPLFVVVATLLYLPMLLRRWRESLLALVVLASLVGPIVVFEIQHQELSTKYFGNTTHLRPDEPVLPQVERTWRYYQQFFSPDFLFENGDPIVRHAVRGHGELLPIFLPFLLIGILVSALWPDRPTKLILWWLALYPVAASLMTEIPSATRSIIGVPAFCLLTAIGFAGALRIIGKLAYFRPLALTLQAVVLVAGLGLVANDAKSYVSAYWNEYPNYSAPTYGGFQYGYRQAIEFMEEHRKEYDILMMTAVDVNQPQVFPQFFRGIPPGQDDGYLILNPAEFGRYSPDKRLLAAVRPEDLDLFSDYDVKKTITAPGGQVEFVIAEMKARKKFLTNWLVLGLFKDEDGNGMTVDHIDVRQPTRDHYQGSFGEIFWRRIAPQFVLVDLNQYFAMSDPRFPGNPERVCAYAAVSIKSPLAQRAFFEISGTDDRFRLWLNGRDLTPFPITLGDRHQNRPIDLLAGDNLLLLKTCENVGGWAFKARITDEAGKDIDGITTAPELPDGKIIPATIADDSQLQLVEGFDEIVAFKHHHEQHADYRGNMQSWWAFVNDNQSEVVWRTAKPAAGKRTVFAFTGSTSHEVGEAELYIDGKYALTFPLDDERSVRTWRRGLYSLTFASKASTAGNSGVYLLDVPAEAVTAGKAAEIRVIPARGKPEAWFGVKAYKDTIVFEKLTAVGAIEALRTGWSPEQTAEAPEPPPRGPDADAVPPREPEITEEPLDDGTDNDSPPDAAPAQPTAAAEPLAAASTPGPRPEPQLDENGVALELSLVDRPEVGPSGEPVIATDVDFDESGGAYVPDYGKLIIPDAGDLIGDSGTISFTVEPGWNGNDTGDHSLVMLRDPKFWENRIQIFKNGTYLRFLFTPDSGKESGVGADISRWEEGVPHHVSAVWSDGLTLLYVDGQFVGSQEYDGRMQLPVGTDLYIGSDHIGGAPGAEARIKDFRAFGRERTADEVARDVPEQP